MQPTNRLGDGREQLATKTRPQVPTFDLANGEYNPDGDHNGGAAKRRRLNDHVLTSGQSSQEPINLVGESPTIQEHGGYIKSRSGYDQSQNGQTRYSENFVDVPSFRKVEKSIRPPNSRKRNSNGSSTSTLGGRGNGDATKREQMRKAASNFESLEPLQGDNPDDPIEEDSDAEPHQVPRIPNQKSRLEFQIRAHEYVGNANLHPPRDKRLGNSKGSTRGSTETGTTPSHFPKPNRNSLQLRHDRNSQPSDVDEQAPNGHPSTKMELPKANSSKRTRGTSTAVHYEDEPSLDELSVQPIQTLARGLVEAARKKPASQLNGQQAKEKVSIVLDDEFNDEIAEEDSASIKPSKFGPTAGTKSTRSSTSHPVKTNTSKTQMPKAHSGQDIYSITEVFSGPKKWHMESQEMEDQEEIWCLKHMHRDQRLMIHDHNGRFEFDLFTKQIDYIELAEGCPRIIIHRLQDFASGTNGRTIHVALGAPDEVESLYERLRQLEPTIKFNAKPASYINKCFDNNRKKKPEPKNQKKVLIGEAEDVTLLRERKEKKLEAVFDRAQESKQGSKGRPTTTAAKPDHARETPRAAGMAKRLEPAEISDDDNWVAPPNRNARALSPNNFYGSSEATTMPMESSRGNRASLRKKVDPPPRQRSPTPIPGWTILNPEWEDKWRSSVVFAGDGKARATVEKTDIPKLNEGEFLNDSLIYFYLLYLQKRLAAKSPELADRIYIQNSFFYERLTKQVKGSRRINYEGVRKWTDRANIDIFKKDYIIVPVNENLHWYVAVICNAPKFLNPEMEESPSQEHDEKLEDLQTPEAALTATSSPQPQAASGVESEIAELSLEDSAKGVDHSQVESPVDYGPAKKLKGANDGLNFEEIRAPEPQNVDEAMAPVVSDIAPPKSTAGSKKKRQSLPRQYSLEDPRIITLDSFGHAHSPVCSNLKEYLVAELKEKRGKEVAPPGSIGVTAKAIPLQDNYCDCGVFLLGYMEKFFADPEEFVANILQPGPDTKPITVDAPKVRNEIRDVLFELEAAQPVPEKKPKKPKRTQNPETKPESAASSKPASREASKSARASAAPEDGNLRTVQEAVDTAFTSESTNASATPASPENRQPARIEGSLPSTLNHEAPKRALMPIVLETRKREKTEISDSDAENTQSTTKVNSSLSVTERSTSKATEVVDDIRETFDTPPIKTASFLGKMGDKLGQMASNYLQNFNGHEKKKSSRQVDESGATEFNPMEIEDSQTSVVREGEMPSEKAGGRRPSSPTPEEDVFMTDNEHFVPELPARLSTPSPRHAPNPTLQKYFKDCDHEVPSSTGLISPIVNGSSSRTMAEAPSPEKEEDDVNNGEMLLGNERTNQRPSSCSPSRESSSKKRARSGAPEQRKKQRNEGDMKQRGIGHNMSLDDTGESSQAVSQRAGKQYSDAHNTLVSKTESGSTHTRFTEE